MYPLSFIKYYVLEQQIFAPINKTNICNLHFVSRKVDKSVENPIRQFNGKIKVKNIEFVPYTHHVYTVCRS